MKYILTITAPFLLLLLPTPPVFAQGAGIEWNILNQEAMELLRTGKYTGAGVLAKKALEMAEQNVGPNHPDVATSLNNLAVAYYGQGEYAQAEALYKRALAIRVEALPAHRKKNVIEFLRTGKYTVTERLASWRKEDLGDVATSLNNLAIVYHTQGQYAQAEPLYKCALAMRAEALGPDHPDVATSLHHLAQAYHAQGKYAQAEALYKRALAIRVEELWGSPADVANTLIDLAALYRATKRDEEAEALEHRAIGIRRRNAPYNLFEWDIAGRKFGPQLAE